MRAIKRNIKRTSYFSCGVYEKGIVKFESSCRKEEEMVALIIIAIIYCCLPWYLEVACFIVNLFFPDPIPLLDELLMFVPIVRKLKRIIAISEIIQKYGKIILTVIALLAVGFIGYLILG